MHLIHLQLKMDTRTVDINSDSKQGMKIIQSGPAGTKEQTTCKISKKLVGGPAFHGN
jgi:hypothetical protein